MRCFAQFFRVKPSNLLESEPSDRQNYFACMQQPLTFTLSSGLRRHRACSRTQSKRPEYGAPKNS